MFNFAQKVGKYLKKYFLNKKEFRCFFTFYKMEDFLGFCTTVQTDGENGILGGSVLQFILYGKLEDFLGER